MFRGVDNRDSNPGSLKQIAHVIMCSQTDQPSPGESIKDVYNISICMFLQYSENLAKIFDVRSSSMCLA
jgi:hypothetical protein